MKRLFTGGRVVSGCGIVMADVLVDGEKIAAVAPHIDAPDAQVMSVVLPYDFSFSCKSASPRLRRSNCRGRCAVPRHKCPGAVFHRAKTGRTLPLRY